MMTKNVLKLTVLAAATLFCTYASANTMSTETQTMTQSTSNVVVPDKTLTKNVQAVIAADPTVSKLPITITTVNGVVTLTGNVNTDEEASSLIQDASSVVGIKDVDASKMVVKQSTQPYTDTVITAKVKGAFIREQLFGDKTVPMMSISVETTNGTVYLTGTADNQAQADEAVTIAKSVDGVNSVKTTVQVKS